MDEIGHNSFNGSSSRLDHAENVSLGSIDDVRGEVTSFLSHKAASRRLQESHRETMLRAIFRARWPILPDLEERESEDGASI